VIEGPLFNYPVTLVSLKHFDFLLYNTTTTTTKIVFILFIPSFIYIPDIHLHTFFYLFFIDCLSRLL